MRFFLLIYLITLSACHEKQTALNPRVPGNSACEKTYSHFYDRSVLDFRIIFGYKDARPARFVGDRYERAYFVQKLLDYGFKRVPSDDDKFVYAFLGPNRRPKQIHLQLVSSSAGPDDNENRKNPFQTSKSAHAEDVFLTGLKTADLIFYYGHSRDGGGPDFAPPKLNAHEHIDYAWYLQHEPGLRKMVAALKQSHAQPQIIGLYSCVSDRLFAHKILGVAPTASLMLSHELLYYIDALSGMFETLTDLIEMKCQPDFHPAGTDVLNFFVKN